MILAPTRTLVLANLLAFAGLAYLWVDQNGHWRNVSWIAPTPVKPVIATALTVDKALEVADPASFAVILERPVFAPDRRPAPPVLPPPPPPPPDPLADARVMGVISGQSAAALMKVDGKVRNVKLTEKVGDWSLQSIDDRNVTFVRNKETRVIKLEYARLAAPTPAVPKVAAAPNGNAPAAAMSDMAIRTQQETDERQRAVRELRARMSAN